MGFVTLSGEPGSNPEEAARLLAGRRRAELVDAAALDSLIDQQFGAEARAAWPGKAWPLVAGSILARLAAENHLVVAVPGAELLFRNLPGVMRVRLVAGESHRIGAVMLEHRLERAAARAQLAAIEKTEREERRRRFGRATLRPELYDLLINAGALDPEAVADLVDHAATARGIFDGGCLSPSAEAQLQFQFRLRLARFGIPPPGQPQLRKTPFVHPSEEIFANLLDFYRIRWEYEPRSFPLAWDKDGRVLEAFTPDFYLPEFDMYVELTTMKQAHVTRKNHKVKLLRSIYPQVNIQVFYQKDIQNLIFKHGLADKSMQA